MCFYAIQLRAYPIQFSKQGFPPGMGSNEVLLGSSLRRIKPFFQHAQPGYQNTNKAKDLIRFILLSLTVVPSAHSASIHESCGTP
jgi:hypothetical protein